MTAGAFGAMSLYGYTTKKDLSGWGPFLMVGLLVAIVASIVNLFIGSTPFEMALSVIIIAISLGITAFHTQMIKDLYSELSGGDMVTKVAIMGALMLYVSFINIFQNLLFLLGMMEE